MGLFKAFDEAHLSYETTAVGDKNVYACMRQNGYSLGGEQSGHIIFGDIECTGDGIMTSLRMMEVIRAERETLSQLCAPVKLYPQELINVRVTDKDVAMNDPRGHRRRAGGRGLPRRSRPRARARLRHRACRAHPRRGADRRALPRGERLRAEGPRAASRLACSPRSGDADARHPRRADAIYRVSLTYHLVSRRGGTMLCT